MRTATPKVRIGEILVEEGMISREQLHEALVEQRESGQALGEMLVSRGIITQTALVRVLAKRLHVRGCLLRPGMVDPDCLRLIGEEEARRLVAIPLFKVRQTVAVAMAEPQSLPKIDRLRQLTGCEIIPVLALESNVLEFICKFADGDVNVDAFLASLSAADVELVSNDDEEEGATTDVARMIDGSPIVNLVNMAIMTAIKDGASDIHIEPERRSTKIRYRIDGALRPLMSPPPGLHSAIVSRVKVIANMDIAEKRLPQEGRVRIHAEGREVDMRVSSMPTVLGEKLVVRVLDKDNLNVEMKNLGFRPETLEAFLRMLRQPYGLVLVTGPTGSGKTTTLYSALELLRDPERNFVTVEDPVEYQLEGINQIQVQGSVGMTFARALRSILRQDPDIIMVGEIRDEETARIAVQAALTGHLVLATLHTNDAPGAVARLIDMSVAPYLLSSALNGVVAQRLARKVCPSCMVDYHPETKTLIDAGVPDKGEHVFRKGMGCQHCHGSGFRGRVGVYEVMELNPTLRDLVHAAAASQEFRALLRRQGALTLREEAVLLALEGRTSLEEVLAVTHSEGSAQSAAESRDRT